MSCMRILKWGVYLLVAMSTPAVGGSVAGTGGATEVTQIMNNAQLLKQVSEATVQTEQAITRVQQGIMQVNQMMKDAQELANPLGLQEITKTYNSVMSEVQRARALTYGVQNMTASFQQLNPNVPMGSALDVQAYINRSNTSMRGIQNALQAGDSVLQRAQDENTRMQELGKLVNDPKGQTAALQTANAIQYEVLQQLRDTKMYSVQMHQAQLSQMNVQAAQDVQSADAKKREREMHERTRNRYKTIN